MLAINSAVCYVLAFLLTTVLHEGAHAVVGAWLGSEPVMHHHYVEHMGRHELLLWQQVMISLAGPGMSLLQGILLTPMVRQRAGGGLFNLFVLWCALLGFGNALGYLMTGPLFTAGDIGKVYQLLGAPWAMRIALAVFGAAGLTYVAYASTRPFLRFSSEQAALEDARARTAFNFRIIISGWVMGALAMTLLYLPVVAIVSIIYPITSGMVFIFPWKQAARINGERAMGSTALTRSAWPLYGSLLAAVMVFRLVLAPGISFQ